MLLDKLCNASGTSGFEGNVREIIKDEIKDYVDDIKIDRMGNIIAHKKGNGKKVVVDVHMDEVGFIVTGYNKDGTLRFSSLGGIVSKVIPCKVVLVGEKRIPGVIGLKPIHLQSNDEKNKNISYSDCCIDIGSNSEDETRKLIDLGEFAVFDTEFGDFGEGLIKGKALDDRLGCAALIEILKGDYKCDLYGTFNVQEEVGERGAFVSSLSIKPDIGIVIEGTICADMPDVPEAFKVTKVGFGPAISIMDRSSIYNTDIISEMVETAKAGNIPYQIRKTGAGGNDAGAIHMSGNGTKVGGVSIPCRYIHSSVSVASSDDYNNTVKLIKEYLANISGGGIK